MASGIFIANVSAVFQKDKLPEAIEEKFALTARAINAGNLSAAQAKIFYAQIVTQAFEQAKLNSATQREVDALSEDNAKTTRRAARGRKPSAS